MDNREELQNQMAEENRQFAEQAKHLGLLDFTVTDEVVNIGSDKTSSYIRLEWVDPSGYPAATSGFLKSGLINQFLKGLLLGVALQKCKKK